MSRKQTKHHKKRAKPQMHQDSGQQHAGENMHISGGIEVDRSPRLEQQHNTERGEDFARENKKWLIERLTLLVVVIYSFLTLLVYLANKKAAKAAEDAAVAAQQSALTAKEQVHAGQRAYLVFEHAEIVGTPAPNWSPTATVQIVNSGQTPAVNVQACFHVVLAGTPPSECSPYRNLGYIGAGRERNQMSSMLNTPTTDQFNAITQKEFTLEGNQLTAHYGLRLFAIGSVRYNDVFGGDGETTLCAVLRERDKAMVACTAGHNEMKYTAK